MTEIKNGIIYKIICKDLKLIDIYIGSTINFKSRKSQHKESCNNDKCIQHYYKIYQMINANGGWNNWEMIEVENFSYINKTDLRIRERFWYDELNCNLNSRLPQRTIEEKVEYNNTYLKTHQDELKEKRKIYRDNDELKKKEVERVRLYRQKNKERLYNESKLKRTTCECGSEYRSQDKWQHIQTKKHQNYILETT